MGKNEAGAHADQDVLVEEHHSIRILTLNRPRALNSINLSVVSRLATLFEEWETDQSVSLILIKAAGSIFSAGGDLKMFYNAGRTGESCKEVVHMKYWLDYHLHTYKKERIVFWHGLVVGGGAGFTFPSKFRVVTEKAAFSTPEVAVGFHTECSASYYLPRLHEHLGEYLALTGTRLDYADMIACGLATHFIPSQDLGEFEKRLLASGNVEELVEEFSKPPTVGANSLLSKMGIINRCFSKNRVEDILEALRSEKSDEEWCEKMIQLLIRLSPTALKQTLASVQRGRHESLGECLRREYRVTLNCLRGVVSDDLYEGIRAVVIDKDNQPKWRPATLSQVSDEMVELILNKCDDQLHLPAEDSKRWTGKFEAAANAARI